MNYYFLYVLTMLLYGSSGVIASFTSLSSPVLMMLRCAIATPLLLLLFFRKKCSFSFLKDRKTAAYLTVGGLCMGSAGIFLFEAFNRIGVGITALIVNCGPLLAMMLTPLFFREKLTGRKVGCVLVAALGVFLINGRLGNVSVDAFGFLCAICAAVITAFGIICGKKASSAGGIPCALVQVFLSFLVAAVTALTATGGRIEVRPGDWLPVLFIGLVNTALGCYMSFESMRHLPAQSVSLMSYLESFFSVLLSVLILHERPASVQWLGAALIVGALLLAERKPKTAGMEKR